MSEEEAKVFEFWTEIYKRAFSIYENPHDAKITADQARKDMIETFNL